MIKGRYVAALLLAVTMLIVAAGAQDPGTPPNGQADPNSVQQEQNVPQDLGLPADDQGYSQDQNRPQLQNREGSNQPQSSVARVSLANGNVSMQRGDSSEWSAVTVNTPLVPGDQIATADRSRAEVQLDFANALRLAGGSQAKIADLSRSRIQVQVALGYASYSVYKGNEAEIEIDTPNVAVHPTRPGRYRVQVNSDYETDVIVRDGEAELTTPQGSTTVKEGQIVTIRGTDNPEYKVENAPPGDDWDRWNSDRDNTIQNASSWQNTNRYYTGSSDLDAHGRWINAPGYGQVWQPYDQGPNWAPYQDGRWVWEPGWGWTWVSYEPWGWAPYHYGRWFYWDTGWVWWPGPVYPYYRPLWAPAYVNFFGFGGGFGFGFGFGSVGWLPCGPFDPFFPWWGFGFNRVTVVNFNFFNVRTFHGPFIRPLGIAGRQPFISNTRLALTNPRVRAGITSVSGTDFVRGGMVSRQRGISESALRGSRMMTANVPVVPTRESLRTGAARSAGVGGFQPRGSNRFVTRNAPPAGPPAFRQQAAQMERVVQNSRRTMTEPSSGRFGNNGRFGESNTRFGNNGNNGTPGRGLNNSPVFSRPGTMEGTRNGSPSGAGSIQGNEGSRSGWRTFGGNTQGPRTSQSNSGGRWWGGGSTNGSRSQLQMAKPIVTPRSTSPAYTYTRPSSPPPSSGQSYGGYNSSRGNSSGSYSGRSYSGGDYNGGRGNGSYGGNYSGGRNSGNYGSYNSGRSSGNYGGYSSGRSSGNYGSYSSGRSSAGYSGGHSSGSYGGSRGGSSGHSSGGSRSSGSGHSNGHR